MAIAQQGNFQDPRPLIQRLRRVDLWKICDFYKIEYDNSVEQPDSLIRKIMGKGIDVNQYVKFNGFGWPFVDLKVRQLPKEIPAIEQEIKPQVKPKQVFATFEEMKVPQLRVLCKQRGIPWTQTEKKVSLIEKLNATRIEKIG